MKGQLRSCWIQAKLSSSTAIPANPSRHDPHNESMDSSWIGKLVGIFVLVAIFGLLWLSHRLEKRGRFRNYSRGLGRGLLAVDEMLRPSKQHVRQAKDEEKKIADGECDGSPPQPR